MKLIAEGGVVSADEKGLTTKEGNHYDVDVVISAVGFDAFRPNVNKVRSSAVFFLKTRARKQTEGENFTRSLLQVHSADGTTQNNESVIFWRPGEKVRCEPLFLNLLGVVH